MGNDTLREAIHTYSELLRVHQLNIELLNTLEQTFFSIQNFCKKHDIPFHDEKLSCLIAKIDSLLEEISEGTSPDALCKPADENLHRKRTDTDLTESGYSFFRALEQALVNFWLNLFIEGV